MIHALGLAPWRMAGAAAALAAAWPASWAAARIARRFAPESSRTLPCAVGCGILFAWGVLVAPDPLLAVIGAALAFALLTLAAIDAAALRLPDAITLPLIAAGLLLAVARHSLASHLIGAVAGYAVLALMAALWRRWRGLEAIGLGDAKLVAAAGAFLGWRALPLVLLIASLAALAWVGARLALRRGLPAGPIAFGPWVAAAFWIVWLYGPSLTR